MPPRRRCIRFGYPTSNRKDREQFPFQLRDAEAGLYIVQALAAQGYLESEAIINDPGVGPGLVPFDFGFFRESDLILLTTRPPMNDDEFGNKKSIPRSFTELEDRLFKGPLGAVFSCCARTEMLLTPTAAAVSAEIAARQSMEFRQNKGAMFRAYGSPMTRTWHRFRGVHPLTAAFLVYAEHAWPGGPAFLAAFAMSGTETLAWCRALAKRFPSLLCATPFAVAEMRTTPPPDKPMTMDFLDSWGVTILGAAEPKTLLAA